MIYLAILIAAIASMGFGGLWYGPIFGKLWMAVSGISAQTLEEAKKKGMAKIYGLNFVFEIITAYVIWTLLTMLSITTLVGAWEFVLWAWIGFAVPIHLGAIMWEGKSWKLFALHTTRQVLSYLIAASIIILIVH